MNRFQYEVRFQHDEINGKVGVVILSKAGETFGYLKGPLAFHALREGEMIEGPTFDDGEGLLQACLDAAWKLGLRPKGVQDEATLKAHLADLRAITFHLLKMRADTSP